MGLHVCLSRFFECLHSDVCSGALLTFNRFIPKSSRRTRRHAVGSDFLLLSPGHVFNLRVEKPSWPWAVQFKTAQSSTFGEVSVFQLVLKRQRHLRKKETVTTHFS